MNFICSSFLEWARSESKKPTRVNLFRFDIFAPYTRKLTSSEKCGQYSQNIEAHRKIQSLKIKRDYQSILLDFLLLNGKLFYVNLYTMVYMNFPVLYII
jgi:hypothetical protein